MNAEFEQLAIEYTNLRTNVDGYFKQTLSKFIQPLKPRRALRPKLRTACALHHLIMPVQTSRVNHCKGAIA